MTGQDILSRCDDVLQDADGTRWAATERCRWLTDACRFVASVKQDAYSVNAAHALVVGAKQSIAAANPPGLRLLDIMRNVGGPAITLVDRSALDQHDRGWYQASPAAVIEHYVYDSRDPTTFYTYPPAANGASVELLYVRQPDEVTTSTLAQPMAINAIYTDALVSLVLYRCYLKDAPFAKNPQLAAGYRSLAAEMLGLKAVSDAKFSPDMNSPAGLPPASGV